MLASQPIPAATRPPTLIIQKPPVRVSRRPPPSSTAPGPPTTVITVASRLATCASSCATTASSSGGGNTSSRPRVRLRRGRAPGRVDDPAVRLLLVVDDDLRARQVGEHAQALDGRVELGMLVRAQRPR